MILDLTLMARMKEVFYRLEDEGLFFLLIVIVLTYMLLRFDLLLNHLDRFLPSLRNNLKEKGVLCLFWAGFWELLMFLRLMCF